MNNLNIKTQSKFLIDRKSYRRRKLKKIIVSFGLLVSLIMSITTIIIVNKHNNDMRSKVDIEKDVSREEVNKISQTNRYNLKIDIPVVDNENVFEKIKLYIEEKEKEFIKIATDGSIVDNENKYEFIVQHQIYNYENIETIHLKIFSYTGGNHSMREDKSFHYSTLTGKEVDLTYFLNTDMCLEKLSELSYEYVKDYINKNNAAFVERMVREGTSDDNIENFNHFCFNDDGLEILFPPYQVAPWSEGEIKINIPYEKLNGILKESFIKISKTENQEDNNIEPQKRDLKQFEGKKLIAFTFDDGPGAASTNKLLDTLDKYNARVTFFVLGNRVKTYENTLKRAYIQGNQIGSHTYSHINLLNLNENEILKEINESNQAIKDVIGVEPKLLRPPYGNTNSNIRKLGKMYTILWNVDTLDWKHKDAEKIKDEIINNAHDGAIVLLHDIYNTSVDGALMAMDELQKDGYAFVTIEELSELKGTKLDVEKAYFNFK